MSCSSVLVLTAAMVVGQADASNEAPKQLKDAMGWLIGNWEGETERDGSKCTVNESIRWLFNRQYIEITWKLTKGSETIESSRITVTWDPIQKKIVGAGIGNAGGYSTGIATSVAAESNSWDVVCVTAKGEKFSAKRTFTKINDSTHRDEGMIADGTKWNNEMKRVKSK